MGAVEADFSGWATRIDLECSDGRTIKSDAFKHMDKKRVPLVWQHGHNDPTKILGHAILEARPEGVRAHAFFNNTPSGKNAKALVEHGDITSLSIYANKLVERAKQIFHGVITEVSLVLAGANPGAFIDNVNIRHGDDVIELDDEVVIYTGLNLWHGEEPVEEDAEEEPVVSHADQTVQDVYNTLTDVQKNVVSFLIGTAVEAASSDTATHSDETKSDETKSDGNNDEGDLKHQEGNDDMTRNVFEQNGKTSEEKRHYVSHEDAKGIMADAMKPGQTLRSAVQAYALAHGVENLDLLFPDAKTINDRPEFISRRMAWVSGVLNGTHHTPFSRIKTIWADITQEEARAKGYITGHYKKEEWFGLSKRTTGPTTVYKKQKLDRDDIIDIVDFDFVAWMRAEMRVMLEEEIARAVLISDGRAIDDEDKIKDPAGSSEGTGIRSIVNEHELFATTVLVNIDDAASNYMEVVESILYARRLYKGSGSPTFYTTNSTVVGMLLTKDTTGRRFWNNKAELASALMVNEIVEVEPMEGIADLVGIIVNLTDYNIGADKGGEVNLFDDFDIDYNQYKYLIETRISGALTKNFSAQIIKKTASANVLVVPTVPTFVASTGVVTIPTKTGVVYKNADTSATLTAGAQTALAAGATLNVLAVAASGYYFSDNASDQWTFKRPAA